MSLQINLFIIINLELCDFGKQMVLSFNLAAQHGAALLSKSFCQGSGGSNPHLETMDVPEPLEDPETSRRHPPWAWLQRSQTGELKWWKARLEPTKELLPGSSDLLMFSILKPGPVRTPKRIRKISNKATSFNTGTHPGHARCALTYYSSSHWRVLARPISKDVPAWLPWPNSQRTPPHRKKSWFDADQKKHLHPFKQVSHPFEVARNGKRGT